MRRFILPALCCFSAASPVLAQSAGGSPSRSLAEVQVTAGSTAVKDLLDTPGSSTVLLTGQSVEASSSQTLTDLFKQVPGVTNFGTTARNSGLSVRGLGNTQFNDGVSSSVGLYVDGVYQPRQAVLAMGLYDLDYAEVRRGPQDASYGLGSTAGDLLVQTRAPEPGHRKSLSYSVGELGFQSATAVFNSPLGQSGVLGRLSVYGQVRDGNLKNLYDGSMINAQNKLGLRGQLAWQPNANSSVRLIGEYGLINQLCCDFPLLGPVSRGTAASDAYMQFQRPGTNPADRVVSNDTPNHQRQSLKALTMIVENQVSERSRLTSISSVQDLSYESFIGDNTPLKLLSGEFSTRSRHMVQELRLSTELKRWRSTAGVFYLKQRINGQEIGTLGPDIARYAFGGQLNQASPALNQSNSGLLIDAVVPPEAVNGLQVVTPGRQEADTLSTYWMNELALSTRTRLTGSVRMTASDRSSSVFRFQRGGNLNASPLAFTNSLNVLGGLLGQDVSGVTFNGLIQDLVGRNFQRTDGRRDFGMSTTFGALHRLTSESSVHVRLASAYKNGGLNLAGTPAYVPAQFERERLNGWEAGWVFNSTSRRLQSQVNVFQSWVKDFQAVTFDQGEGLIRVPRQSVVLNIPRVKLQGVEWNASGRFGANWALGGGLSYTEAISTRFPNAPNEDTNQADKDLSGRQLFNAPRWSGFLGFEHTLARVNGAQWYWGGNAMFKSSYFGAVEQSRTSFIDGYEVLDARVGVRSLKPGWQVEAWVRNLLDERYLSGVSNVYGIGDYGGIAGDARMLGLTTSFTLGP